MPDDKGTRLRTVFTQNTEELEELKQKIKKHRIRIAIIVLVVVFMVVIAIDLLVLYYQRKTYTSFEVLSETVQEDSGAAEYEDFCGNILKYTRDGAVYGDFSGNMIWNQTYEMETPKISMCETFLTIYEQNGTTIYILNTKGWQGTIHTTIPIQKVSVGRQGTVAVLMQDAETSYLHLYDKSGKQLAAGEMHVENSGYPVDIALSADAQKLAVSLLDINEGDVKTTVVFYNYGTVGQNEIDNIVGSFSYSDIVIPRIQFVSNNRLLAFGDTEAVVYECKQKPVVKKEIDFRQDILSVYYNNDYFGVVSAKENSANEYQTIIYNKKGKMVASLDYALDYTDISFLQNDTVCIHNDKKCLIYTLKGNKKFDYQFEQNIYSIISGNSQRDYVFILNGKTLHAKLNDGK